MCECLSGSNEIPGKKREKRRKQEMVGRMSKRREWKQAELCARKKGFAG